MCLTDMFRKSLWNVIKCIREHRGHEKHPEHLWDLSATAACMNCFGRLPVFERCSQAHRYWQLVFFWTVQPVIKPECFDNLWKQRRGPIGINHIRPTIGWPKGWRWWFPSVGCASNEWYPPPGPAGHFGFISKVLGAERRSANFDSENLITQESHVHQRWKN